MEGDREKLIALHAVHGEELSDYALCGYAHNVFCEKCRETLDRIRNNYQGYRRKTKATKS
jgi:hypothetical protein